MLCERPGVLLPLLSCLVASGALSKDDSGLQPRALINHPRPSQPIAELSTSKSMKLVTVASIWKVRFALHSRVPTPLQTHNGLLSDLSKPAPGRKIRVKTVRPAPHRCLARGATSPSRALSLRSCPRAHLRASRAGAQREPEVSRFRGHALCASSHLTRFPSFHSLPLPRCVGGRGAAPDGMLPRGFFGVVSMEVRRPHSGALGASAQ